MKIRVVRYLPVVALVAPLLLNGCGDNDGVPIPTPVPVGPTWTATPTRTGSPATPTRTGTPATATPTRTGSPATPTRTGTAATATPSGTPATATPTRTGTPPTATPTGTAATATPTGTAATATPSATTTTTPTPTPTSGTPVPGAGIAISKVTATAGQQVTVTGSLATGGGSVAGTQNDFTFATAENRNVTVTRKANGKPDCAVNGAIDKGSTSFAFQPPSCTVDTCLAVRAIVFSTDNTDPIPDGSVLYTCKVDVLAGAPAGVYPLAVTGAILSNPTGGRVCGTGASDPQCTGNQDGSVTVQ